MSHNQEHSPSQQNMRYTEEQRYLFGKMQQAIIYRRRRLAVVFGVSLIVFLLLGVNIIKNYHKLSVVDQEASVVMKEQKELKKQHEALANEVALLKDNEYLEKLARTKYFYSREGEQVYHFPSSSRTQEEQADEQETDSDG